MRSCMLVYDIPTHPAARIRPPTFLRRIGVRVNLSCWIVPDHLLPWDWIEEVGRGGGVARVVRFDVDESDNIRSTAIEVLRSDLTRMNKSLNAMMAKAKARREFCEERQARAAATGRTSAWQDEYDAAMRYVKTNHYRAMRLMRDAQAAMLIFEITNELDDAMRALRDLIKVQQHDFFTVCV